MSEMISSEEIAALLAVENAKEPVFYPQVDGVTPTVIRQEPCEDAISRQAVLDYIYNALGLGDEENGNDVERQMELERSYKYVKSLPPVAPKTCNDAISRQEEISIPKNALKWRGGDIVAYNVEWFKHHWQKEVDIVCGVKTIPERDIGHWDRDVDNLRRWDRVRFYCSECGEWQTYGETRFCPSCGAYMMEE